MQHMLIIVALALLAIVAAKPTEAASLLPAALSPFGIYPGSGAPFASAPYATAPFATPLGNPSGVPLGASPLAVSSSQRLDYFNQFNAAYAPTASARFLAGGAVPFSGPFAAPAPPRFIQPGRWVAPGVAAPFFF